MPINWTARATHVLGLGDGERQTKADSARGRVLTAVVPQIAEALERAHQVGRFETIADIRDALTAASEGTLRDRLHEERWIAPTGDADE